MNTPAKPALQKAYAGIDLGNGSYVEITGSAVNILGTARLPRSNGSTSQLVNQIAELANRLRNSRATIAEIDRAAATEDLAPLDDRTIELLAGRSSDLIPRDAEGAYFLLRLTYGLARRHATFWKHALVASVLGFLVLYNRRSPAEAIPIFRDLEIVSRILGSYLGCSDSARGLSQLAGRGLQEASAALEAQEIADGSESLSAQVWSAIQEYSTGPDEVHFFMQSEAFARGLLLLGEQLDKPVLDELCEMGQNHLRGAEHKSGSFPQYAGFPTITLAEILAEYGFKTQALALLESVRQFWGDASPLLQIILANRVAALELSLGHRDTAQQLLDSIPRNEIANLSAHSVTEQGELVLYAINRAQTSCAQEDEVTTHRWAKEAARQLQSMEQWNQVSSSTRQDDLRLLYCAILRNAARERLAELRK